MIRISVVDAFTKDIFGGNPAAVCLLEKVSRGQGVRNVCLEICFISTNNKE